MSSSTYDPDASQAIVRLAGTSDHDLVAEVLKRDGALVVEGLIGVDAIERLAAELEPHVASRAPGFLSEHDSYFYGRNTKRIQGLAAKSPTYVAEYLLHPLLLHAAEAMLGVHGGDFWLSQAETIFIGPVEPAQILHRDDEGWIHAARLGMDLQVSTLLAVGDYDAEVGATMVIPGSHLWPVDQPFDPSQAVPVELEMGDALIYMGNIVHGGGENKTSDRWRQGLYQAYLLGWLVPEEAVALQLTPEQAGHLPQRARELLGWSNIRSDSDPDQPSAALALWQLDAADLERLEGQFVPRQ